MVLLAWRRFIRGTSRTAVVAVLCLVFLGATGALAQTATKVRVDALNYKLAAAPYEDASVSVIFEGQTSDLGQVRQIVSTTLAQLGVAQPTYFVTYRPIPAGHGTIVHLVGISADQLKLLSGTFPGKCEPQHCEVAKLSGQVDASQYGLVQTGEVESKTAALGALTLQPDVPVLVSTDIDGLLALPSIAQLPRTMVWTGPLSASTVTKQGTASFLSAAQRKADEISLSNSHLVLRFPASGLATTVQQSQAATNRLDRLVLALALAVLLGLGLVAGWAEQATRSGAQVVEQLQAKPRWQFAWVTAAISTLPAGAIGGLIAWLLGTQLSLIAIFVVSAFVVVGVALQLGPLPSSALVLVVLALTAIRTRNALEIVSLLAICATWLALPVLRSSWRTPIRLAAARANALAGATLVTALCAGLLSSWATTATALDHQESMHIDFLAPTSVRVASLNDSVLQNIPLSFYQQSGPALQISKIPSTTTGSGFGARAIQLIGAPAALASKDFTQIGGPSAAQLAQIVTRTAPPGVPGSTIKVLNWPARSAVGFWALTADGQSVRVESGAAAPADSRVLGVEVYEPPDELGRRQHAMGEGDTAVVAPAGELRVQLPDGQILARQVDLVNGTSYLPLTAAPEVVPAIVDANTARVGTDLVLRLAGGMAVSVKVVGTVDRFPTATPHFAVVDQSALTALLAATDPGLIRTAEIWLANDSLGQNAHLTALSVTKRSDLLRAFGQDPVRHGSRQAFYLLAGLFALVLFGLALRTTTNAISEENPREWQGRGLTPIMLSRNVATVTARTLIAGGTLGSVVGVLVTAQLVKAESVTWSGIAAIPPVASYLPIWLPISQVVAVAGVVIAAVGLGGWRRGH